MELAGKTIVLGLTGGIACYKSAELTRLFIKAGATVQVVMTDAATPIINPPTLALIHLRRGRRIALCRSRWGAAALKKKLNQKDEYAAQV